MASMNGACHPIWYMERGPGEIPGPFPQKLDVFFVSGLDRIGRFPGQQFCVQQLVWHSVLCEGTQLFV